VSVAFVSAKTVKDERIKDVTAAVDMTLNAFNLLFFIYVSPFFN
jgi:hypothetical protein